MTFEEFSRIIREGLQEQLEDGISISLDQIKENNGTVRTVLTLSRGKGGLSPGFDMRSLYEQYQEMGEDWEAMDQVLRSLREAGSGIERERAKREEIGDILDYEQWKESIVFRSVNTEKNRELLKERPGIPFLDLSLMFWVYRRTGTGAIVEFPINDRCMEIWQVTVSQLEEQARRNTPRLLPVKITGMRRLMELLQFRTGEVERDAFCLLSNAPGRYGAAAIVYEGILNELWDRLGGDFTLIPLSVHEMLAVSDSIQSLAVKLREILREGFGITQEEWLSDHMYHYCREKGKLEIEE